MSGDGRKSNKQFPGSVPRANNRQPGRSREDSEHTNFPSTSWHILSDTSNFIRNSPRSQRNNYHQLAMDTAALEDTLATQDLRNVAFCNGHVVTSDSNSQHSRRNSTSSALKCDNVTKYPDKAQIEDKLKQIREYLQITTAMLGGLKNSDDVEDVSEKTGLLKMKSDLLDSESKLVNILEEMNRIGSRSENNQTLVNNNALTQPAGLSHRNDSFDSQVNGFESPDLDVLREHQLSLLRLQQKAENKLRDARLVQERMSMGANSSALLNSQTKDNKNMSLGDFDSAIKELEERAKQLNRSSEQRKSGNNAVVVAGGPANPADRIMNEIENLHHQIVGMRSANNEREELIEVLDTRDAELRSQQAELQKKLNELQNKKLQVDQLALQLQNINDEDEDGARSDVGVQVTKIVTMKDQLKKLKDMLEIVKTTENVMTNSNTCSAEAQLTANEICQTAENFLQNQIHKARPLSNDQNIGMRFENNCVVQKETNSRNQMDGGNPRPKPSSSSINEKLALKAELEARKRELEEIMGKHKAGTSNLNHDVGTVDNKSDYGSGTSYPQFWKSRPNHEQDSEGFSSEDENDYSEVHENQNLLPLLQSASRFDATRSRPPVKPEHDISAERLQNFTHQSPDRNLRSVSATASEINSNNISSREPETEGQKLQKQLQLIKNVCDSVLERQRQQSTSAQPTQSNHFQQVRNNITPSASIYSEPSNFSNNPNSLPPVPDMTWFNQLNPTMPPPQPPDMANYQNWLATNTLQTQSFMLNTLNQCCQMLWLQQREMVALRSSVQLLQEKIDSHQCSLTSTSQPNLLQQHLLETPRTSSNLLQPPQINRSNLTQPNQVSAACSLPNLNHFNTNSPIGQSNFECINLNNAPPPNLNLQVSTEQLNNMLHSLNSNPVNIPPTWNATALNNQVPPGNRANNYWDNFRSYSRQNLLSTKNTECSHSSAATSDRANQLLSVCVPNKSNSNSHETVSQRKALHNLVTQGSNAIDHVQNLTSQLHNLSFQAQNLATQENDTNPSTSRLDVPSTTSDQQGTNEEIPLSSLQALLNLNSSNEHSLNLSEAGTSKDSLNQRNEWHEEQQSKTNKPEERENAYKQVASQLFKDLQKIESDTLRLKVLQSLQSSLGHVYTSKQLKEPSSIETLPAASVWERPSTSTLGPFQLCSSQDEPLMQNSYKEILSLLEAHESEIVNHQLLLALKQVFLGSESFRDTFKDSVFQRHFSNVLDEGLEQFRGKKIQDVRLHLIQTVGDLLQSELSFIHLLQETNPGNLVLRESTECSSSFSADWPLLSPLEMNLQSSTQNSGGHAIQNGDLAEADQSRLTENEIEEDERDNVLDVEDGQHTSSEEASNSQDFSSNGEGLDQVPIRLPTKSKSRSSTPNKE